MSKKDEKRTVFRRIGGRIVPITIGVGAGAAAFERSRRSTVSKSKDFDIIKRNAIFSKKVSFTAKNRSFVGRFLGLKINKNPTGLTLGKAVVRPDKKRLFVETIFGISPKANLSLLSNIKKHAKQTKKRSITGNIANVDIARMLEKKGATFTSLSKSGLKRISGKAARGEITRLLKGNVRGIIRPILRIK